MSETIISVENLSKRFTLGASRRRDTLRDRLADGLADWWDRLRLTPRPPGSSPPAPKPAAEAFWALRDLSFEVKRGEVVGIIGRNGAGKSTLLKILSRITEPTSGRAVLRGRVASLLEVGTGFHPDLSGRDNIFLNGAILGMSRIEIRKKFDEIVAFAEVEHFLDTAVKHYSSGMYVRLAFSIAAHLEPEILIVDEVLAVGDIAFQKKCIGKMQSVAAGGGRTVLFVSHNIDAVRRLCSTAVLLAGGRVQALGPTPGVLERYLRDYSSLEKPRIPAPSPDLRARAYVTGTVIENSAGQPVSVVSVGEPWRARISFCAGRAYDGFVVGFGLVSLDGSPAQTAWSEPARVEPGDHEALFEQMTFLQAGSYALVVGLSARDQGIQQIEASRLDISGENPRGHFPATAGVGVVLNSMRVSLRKI